MELKEAKQRLAVDAAKKALLEKAAKVVAESEKSDESSEESVVE